MSETKSEADFQINAPQGELVEVVPVPEPAKPKRKPKQKAVVEKPVDVKEEAEKLLFEEKVEAPKPPTPPKPPVAKEEPKVEPKPEPKPAPVLKAPPVRPPVLYGMQKVKRRLKARRNIT